MDCGEECPRGLMNVEPPWARVDQKKGKVDPDWGKFDVGRSLRELEKNKEDKTKTLWQSWGI